MSKQLTARQLKFIDLYDGNGTDAARKSGYKGSDNVLAQTARGLLRNPQIVNSIKERHDKAKAPLIAKRKQRQRFWTKVMGDPTEKMKDRLKASELLGKSEADFTENVALGKSLVTTMTVLSEEQFRELRDKFNSEY